jgi:hypothetical protein
MECYGHPKRTTQIQNESDSLSNFHGAMLALDNMQRR